MPKKRGLVERTDSAAASDALALQKWQSAARRITDTLWILTAKERAVIEQTFLLQRKNREAAKELGISRYHLKRLKASALAKLREVFA